MAVFELTCAGCGESFEAKSAKAKWCSAACRKRQQRSPDSESDVRELEPGARVDVDAHGLVVAVRTQLEQADRMNTWQGQQALQVARRLADPDESGVGALSKELSRTMAAALEGWSDPATGAQATESDEVARARARREEIAAAAAAGAEG